MWVIRRQRRSLENSIFCNLYNDELQGIANGDIRNVAVDPEGIEKIKSVDFLKVASSRGGVIF